MTRAPYGGNHISEHEIGNWVVRTYVDRAGNWSAQMAVPGRPWWMGGHRVTGATQAEVLAAAEAFAAGPRKPYTKPEVQRGDEEAQISALCARNPYM
jgi:hypothetical protein